MGEVANLEKNMLPCISHVVLDKNYEHFITIYDINLKKDKITIIDPIDGLKQLSLKEYNNISTNQYILLQPNKALPNLLNKNKIFTIIINFLNRYKNIFLTIFLFSFLYTISNIILSYHFQFIIESSINIKSLNNLYFISIFILLISIFKITMDFFRNKLINYINHKLDYTMVKDVFNHIISLPYLYYKNRTTGEITSRINDISEIKEAFNQIIITLFVDLILIIVVFIQLLNISTILTSILILSTIIYIILITLYHPKLNKKVSNIYLKSGKLNSFMIESINSVDTIKNNQLEEKITDDFDISYSKLLNDTYKLNDIYYKQNVFKELIYYISLSLIIFIGSRLVLDNKLSLASLITYNSLLIYYIEPIKNIFDIDLTLKKVKNSISRAKELLQIPKEKQILDNKYTNKKIKGKIQVKSLSYSYTKDITILNNLNLNINQGSKILLHGNSGSGKSTFAKILMGYIKVPNNKIFIDEKDINNYNLIDLRNEICYVSQNEYLYTESIHNNVVLDKYIDYDTFLHICKITKVDEIVKDKLLLYDTLLEENGFNISGGERQRIILARALLNKKSIYIFDESLSQIDIKKERIILQNIFSLLKDKTIIVISHRFNNSDLFDKKINIEKRTNYD